MLSNASGERGSLFGRALRYLAVMTLAFAGSAAAQAPSPAGGGAAVSSEATVESLFADFLHFARMGRFTAAEAFAQKLLTHPELDPVRLLELADEDRDSIDSLLILIKISRIGASAARVLDVIQQGEHQKRQSRGRILRNIQLLGGDPQQEYFAIKYLRESGEYAIPHLVQTLLDPARSELWPRVVTALPKMGKPAVNPLVMALAAREGAVKLSLIQSLGEIGYPQAIPYLRRLSLDSTTPADAKAAAARAVERIEQIVGRPYPGSPDELFYELADRYYNEDDAVRADPRLETANVWYFNDAEQTLTHVVVPQRIFGQVMSMRCCEEAMRLRNDHTDAIGLWLAANVRREGRLSMDVESRDPEESGEADATRPAVFPRALYFSQAAGPRYAHLMLDRAVRHNDSSVALGAIEALRVTAGESSLVGSEDFKQPLVMALQFPDLVVRIRASLALGASLPKSQFSGSQLVVPVLASALGQTGREQILVVETDEPNGARIAGAIRGTDRDAAADTSFFRAMQRARTEFQALSGLFISTDSSQPDVAEAVRRLRAEFIFSKVPVVILAKPGQTALAMELAGNDPYVEAVDAAGGDGDLMAAFDRVRARTGQAPLDADLALSMALEATETLRRIAVDGRTVFDVGDAEPALIAILSSPEERLQTLAASVLALLRTPTAQRAVAHIALDGGRTDSLRIAAFSALAESSKNNGNMLEEAQINALVDLSRDEPDLTIRTAASQALGAVNLHTNQASHIIRSYYGG